ncbi:MAG TPA: Rieske 2Fe-2S domain-containing protein [Stellaceae bacterium]|nr:Rieske 2Fe-2S domain-containing protein [Stellaceae bacterium]
MRGKDLAAERAKPLREMWYYAMPSAALKPGRLLPRVYLGEPIVFGRGRDGTVFGLRDLCPHRGIPLHYGKFSDGEIECAYHGWRFKPNGRCAAIPSLPKLHPHDVSRICVPAYKVREVQGNIWVFFGEDPDSAPAIPVLPDIAGAARPNLTYSVHVKTRPDDALYNLVDPTHNPYIHVSWWWRRRGSAREKEKAFVPSDYGFTMVPHRPSSNYAPYRLLGGKAQTQIIFRLPGIRIEHIEFGRHRLVTLNTITAISDNEIEESYAIYWTNPLLKLLKPLGRVIVSAFAAQDGGAMRLQARSAKYDPPTMLIDDADTQAKWCYRLKQEYARACAEKRPFVNPVEARVLRFRS